MKTTIEIPDELLIAAKKKAAEERTTLRQLFARGLRRELEGPALRRRTEKAGRIRWIVVDGGLPPGSDPSDREAMHDWLALLGHVDPALHLDL